jgi:addiction module HigA family antidote
MRGVRLIKVDVKLCPSCTNDLDDLKVALYWSTDVTGNILANFDFSQCFLNLAIVAVYIGGYNYDLTLQCLAKCSVDKPSIEWVITNWKCPNQSSQVDKMTPNQMTPYDRMDAPPPPDDIKPTHPGKFLKRWLSRQPPQTKAHLIEATGITESYLDEVLSGDASIDVPIALELYKVIGGEAEMWFRMQSDYDFYKRTGYRLNKSDMPKLVFGS